MLVIRQRMSSCTYRANLRVGLQNAGTNSSAISFYSTCEKLAPWKIEASTEHFFFTYFARLISLQRHRVLLLERYQVLEEQLPVTRLVPSRTRYRTCSVRPLPAACVFSCLKLAAVDVWFSTCCY